MSTDGMQAKVAERAMKAMGINVVRLQPGDVWSGRDMEGGEVRVISMTEGGKQPVRPTSFALAIGLVIATIVSIGISVILVGLLLWGAKEIWGNVL